ncbi:MAG: alginate lyase family protein [Limnochordia bacterium]
MRSAMFVWMLALLMCMLVFSTGVLAGAHSPYYTYPTIELSMEEFFAAFDYDIPALAKVEAAVKDGDFDTAAKELREYLAANKGDAQQAFGIGPLRTPAFSIRLPDPDLVLRRQYSRGNVTYWFDGEIDWVYNPTRAPGYKGDYDKEWTAWLTRFNQLATLTDAYRLTAYEGYALEAIHLMKHFLSTLPVPANKGETGEIAHDMYLIYNELSTASRAGSWVRGILSLVDSPLLTSEDLVVVLKGLYEHMLRMGRHVAATPNWRAVEIRAMIDATVAFPEFKKSQEWRDWAIQRLVKEMDEQVYPDGAQIELDPGYHHLTMSSFYKSAELIDKVGLPLSGDLLERLAAMGRFPIKISRPDGSLPAFGDASQRTSSQGYRNHAAVVAQLTGDTDEILWYATSGKEGRRPAYDSVALDWSGYYVMRSGWEKDDLYMAIKAGPYGAAHQNEDKLSFELCGYGERFLVDPGLYIYDSANPWRKYFVSSLAHNTVVVDGLSQYRRDVRDQWVSSEPNDALWISEPNYDYFSGVYDFGYADFMRYPSTATGQKLRVAHQRDVLFIRRGMWLILDWLTPADRDEHTYEALFQSLWSVNRRDNGFVVGERTGTTAATLGIYPVGSGLEYELATAQTEPIRRGWIYSANSWLEALPTAVVRQKTSGSTGQAYFLIPEPGGQKEVSIRPVDVEGRSAIGGVLETADGLSITFIAQKRPGQVISYGDLQTNGRLKLVIREGATEEVIEIPFEEGADSIYGADGELDVSPLHLQDPEALGLPLVFKTDFETTTVGEFPDDWLLIEQKRSPDAPYVIEAPDKIGAPSGERVLFLGRTADASTETSYAAMVFPPAKERLRVSFDMFVTSGRRSLRVTLGGSSRPPASVHPGSANSAIFLGFWKDGVHALTGKPAQNWAGGGTYTSGHWHKVTLDIDVAAQNYNVFLDDSPLPQNAAPISFYSQEYDDLNTIAFAYQSFSAENNTEPAYVDNVQIWGK